MLDETAIKFQGIGIDQQLGRIEPQVAGRIVSSVGAVGIAGAAEVAGDFERPDLARAGHGMARFGLAASKQAQLHRPGQRRAHRKAGPPACDLGAKRPGHVTTSGAVRPVCAAIPAMASAAAISSASMAGVSSANLPPGPS